MNREREMIYSPRSRNNANNIRSTRETPTVSLYRLSTFPAQMNPRIGPKRNRSLSYFPALSRLRKYHGDAIESDGEEMYA